MMVSHVLWLIYARDTCKSGSDQNKHPNTAHLNTARAGMDTLEQHYQP